MESTSACDHDDDPTLYSRAGSYNSVHAASLYIYTCTKYRHRLVPLPCTIHPSPQLGLGPHTVHGTPIGYYTYRANNPSLVGLTFTASERTSSVYGSSECITPSSVTVCVCVCVGALEEENHTPHQTWYTMLQDLGKRSKGQGHTVTKTVTNVCCCSRPAWEGLHDV